MKKLCGGSVCHSRVRAKRAINSLAKNARHWHSAPRSLDRQKRAARDDNGKLAHCQKLLMAALALLLMAGCTSEPTPQAEKPQPTPPAFETGRVAFQKMYIAARGWQRDAQAFRLQSDITADYRGKDGKSDVWRAWFASPSQRSAKPFAWSGTDVPDAPARGVNPGAEDTYNPTNTSTQIFDIAFLKVDSDKAFEVGQQHGGDKILEADPSAPIFYVLDWNRATNQLVWHVIYGTNREDAKLRVAVDASSGDFLRIEK